MAEGDSYATLSEGEAEGMRSLRRRNNPPEFNLPADEESRLIERLSLYNPLNRGTTNQETLQYRASEATRRYLGHEASSATERLTQKLYDKNEKKAGSKYVSQHAAQVIDGIYSVMSSGLLSRRLKISARPYSQEDQEAADEAAEFAYKTLLCNPANTKQFKDFIKSGVMYPIAVLHCSQFQRDDKILFAEEASFMQILRLERDPQAEIIEIDPVRVKSSSQNPGGKAFNIKYRRTMRPETIIENVPVEEMVIPGESETLDQSEAVGPAYIGRKRLLRLDAIVGMYPHRRKMIIDGLRRSKKLREKGAYDGGSAPGDWGDVESSPSFRKRHDDDAGASVTRQNEWSNSYYISEEYLWFDPKPDEFKLLRVIRIDADIIIEISEVERNPFAFFSILPIPNRAVGKSVDEIIGQDVEMLTALHRYLNQVLARDLAPTTLINRNMVRPTERSQFLNRRAPGSKYYVDGDPREAVFELTGATTGAIAEVASAAIEMTARHSLERVGLAHALRGTFDNAPNTGRSASGLHLAHEQGMILMRQMAGQIADGINMAARIIVAMAREGRVALPYGGDVDPSMWPADVHFETNLAAILDSREQKMQEFGLIFNLMEKILATPYAAELHGVKQIRNLLRAMFETLNQDYAEAFLKPLAPGADERIAAAMEGDQPYQITVAEIQAETQKQIAQMKEAGESQRLVLEMSADEEKEARKILADLKQKLVEMRMDDMSDREQRLYEFVLAIYEMLTKVKVAEISAEAAKQKAAEASKNAAGSTRMGGKKV